MSTEVIRQQIHNAIAEEATSHHLQHALSQRASQVARIIDLPDGEPAEKLLQFVVRYIEDAPQMLHDLQDAALEAGLTQYVAPIVQVASEFFTLPPKGLNEGTALTCLMGKAYLAQRLLEEVNETYIAQVGQPMVPMDMTLSNVIVHTLIGEPFANDLDQLVNVAVERLFGPKKAYQNPDFKAFMSRLQATNLVRIGSRWSSMSGEMGLNSNLL